MSINQKSIQTPKINNINKTNDINNISKRFSSISPSESPSNIFNHNRIKSYSESNTKTNDKTNPPQQNTNMIFSTLYQTFNNPEEENDLSLGQQINTIFNDDSENSINQIIFKR